MSISIVGKQGAVHGCWSLEEAQQEQEISKEIGQTIWCVLSQWSSYQTDPTFVRTRFKQSRQVSWSFVPSRIDEHENRWS